MVLVSRTNQSKQVVATAIDQQTGQFVINANQDWQVGSILGEMVFVSYVRFHARVTTSVIALLQREQRLGHAVMAQ